MTRYNVVPENIHSPRGNWPDILEGWWWGFKDLGNSVEQGN